MKSVLIWMDTEEYEFLTEIKRKYNMTWRAFLLKAAELLVEGENE